MPFHHKLVDLVTGNGGNDDPDEPGSDVRVRLVDPEVSPVNTAVTPPKTSSQDFGPQQPINNIVETLIHNMGLTWMLPTIRALIQQESSNNPYVIHTGKIHTKRVEKLLGRLEEETGTVWTLNPLGESTADNEISVGLWQYNLGIGRGNDFTQLGDPDLATDQELIQAMVSLSDPVPVSLDALQYISDQADYLRDKGLSPGEVAEGALRPWAGRKVALAAYTPTSFDEVLTETSLVPDRKDYFSDQEWAADVRDRAVTMVQANWALPEDAPEYFRLQYEAAQQLFKDSKPTAEDSQRARLELDQLRLGNRQRQQALNVTETGPQGILLEESGQRGYRDYWAGQPASEAYAGDANYFAGYNLGKQEERPELQGAAAAQMDRIIDYISQSIEAKKLTTTQVIQEFNRNLAAFEEGGEQFLKALPYAISPGRKYLPGYEPGGFAESIGLKPRTFTGIDFNPIAGAQEVLDKSPSVTSVGSVDLDPPDPSGFNKALEYYRSLQ